MNTQITTVGDIKLFAGSGCPDLAQRVAEYVNIPLSPCLYK